MTKNEIIKVFLHEADSKSRKYSECTKNTYLSYITKYIESLNKDVSESTERDVRKFMDRYENMSDKTYNLALTSIKVLYDILTTSILVEENYIKKNPVKNIKAIANPKSKEKKSISAEDYNAMLRQCKNTRDTAILTFLMNTGVRESELINLTLEQYLNRDEDNGIKLVVTKGSKERMIYLNENVINAIENYLPFRKPNCDYLFVSNGSKKMTSSAIWKNIKTLAKRARLDEDVIDNLSAHSFRHSMISNMINEGVNIATVATIVGHNNINTTMGYVDRDKLDVKNAMLNCI